MAVADSRDVERARIVDWDGVIIVALLKKASFIGLAAVAVLAVGSPAFAATAGVSDRLTQLSGSDAAY